MRTSSSGWKRTRLSRTQSVFACSKTDRTRCIAVTTASHDCCARLDISTLEMIRSSLHCAWAAARGRPCWILGTPHLDLTVRRAARLAAMLGLGESCAAVWNEFRWVLTAAFYGRAECSSWFVFIFRCYASCRIEPAYGLGLSLFTLP